jgi:hypothetical protein
MKAKKKSSEKETKNNRKNQGNHELVLWKKNQQLTQTLSQTN